MKKILKWPLLAMAAAVLLTAVGCSDDDDNSPAPQGEVTIEQAFATSLHGTRAGKETWYNDEDGFQSVVTVDYADLPCADCHNKAAWENRPEAEGGARAWTGPNCLDCHQAEPGDAVADSTCLGCHSRQGTEVTLGLTDVHREGLGMGCMDCHSSGDVHGDGTAYPTMFAPGAIDAKCSNCHAEVEVAGVNAFHDPTHMDAIDCSACHMTSAIACYNCHFDNEADETGAILHAKFASAKFGGPGEKSWRFLVNRVVDEQGNTKIFAGSMQSLMADVTSSASPGEDNLGATFVAIGPYYSHSIQKSAITCEDCHASAALQQYVNQGEIDVVKWKPEAGVEIAPADMGAQGWQAPKGVIPIPPDYDTALNFDFVDLVDPGAPLNASNTSSSNRVLFKRGVDAIHFVDEYVRPLTAEQMSKLGWFATSLHATRQGKKTWYEDGMGETAAELQQGFGNFVEVSYDTLPCADCHNATAWTDGEGNDQWPGNPVCRDCHDSEIPVVGSTVDASTCYGCHSRQGKEKTLSMANVHGDEVDDDGDGVADQLSCMDCHGLSDVHGDGEIKATMFSAGAMTADCQSCHGIPELTAGGTHGDAHSIHAATVDCSACHMESAIACYNCHFDNEVDNHAKFASGFFGGTIESGKSWRFLVNRVMPDGSTKVFPGSMQSLMADVHALDGVEDDAGVTFVAIGPYFAHAVMPKAQTLGCGDCHATAKVLAITGGSPVDVVRDADQDGTWDLTPQGVIPVPEDVSLLNFDFVDLVDPSQNSTSARKFFKAGADVVHMPEDYVRPLSAAQLNILSNGCAGCHRNTLP